MNSLNITRFKEGEIEVDMREMGEFEIRGAMLSVYQLAKEFDQGEFGESFVTMDKVDDDCYYCNKKLEFTSKYLVYDEDGRGIAIDSLFVMKGSIDNLWGYAYDHSDEDEEDLFLIRIS